MKDHFVLVDQTRYSTSILAKYMDDTTVKKSTKFLKTTLPSGMILTNDNAYTSGDKFKKLTKAFNIHYRSCIG